MALSVRAHVAERRTARLHPRRQLHGERLRAFLQGHRLRGRLGHAPGHRATGSGSAGPRRTGALSVRDGDRNAAGLPLQHVPGRRARRGERRGRRNGEHAERRAVQTLAHRAEAARASAGAARERTRGHAAELHDRHLHQRRGVLTLTHTHITFISTLIRRNDSSRPTERP